MKQKLKQIAVKVRATNTTATAFAVDLVDLTREQMALHQQVEDRHSRGLRPPTHVRVNRSSFHI